MKRIIRIIIEVALPGFLGTCVFAAITGGDTGGMDWLESFLSLLVISYFFVGLQSAVYAYFMEKMIENGTERKVIVIRSIWIGGISGLIGGSILGFGVASLLFGVGVAVGCLIPFIIFPLVADSEWGRAGVDRNADARI